MSKFAMAYAMKKRNKKMYADGGEADIEDVEMEHPEDAKAFYEGDLNAAKMEKNEEDKKNSVAKMAHGGMLTHDGYQSECNAHCNHPGMPHPKASGYVEHEEDDVKHDHMAMEEDDRDLNQHGEDEEGPMGAHMAHGGLMKALHGEQSKSHEEDMVGRVMKKRQHMYSKGGMIANESLPDADFDENEFDDLAKDDHLESKQHDYGDEDGNKYDADHEDMVGKVMMKRKKQRNPNPA